jgi:hypothetical protein
VARTYAAQQRRHAGVQAAAGPPRRRHWPVNDCSAVRRSVADAQLVLAALAVQEKVHLLGREVGQFLVVIEGHMPCGSLNEKAF